MALGRSKLGRRQQPDTSTAEEEAAPDSELESYLAALAPEESVETTGSGRRFGAAQVYQLRLPLMANERLKELAARQGVSPATLARDWVLQHLHQEPPRSATDWPQQDAAPDRTPSHAKPSGAPRGLPDDATDPEITIPGRYTR